MGENEGKRGGWRGKLCAPGGVGRANDHDRASDEPQGQSWARVWESESKGEGGTRGDSPSVFGSVCPVAVGRA